MKTMIQNNEISSSKTSKKIGKGYAGKFVQCHMKQQT